MLGAACCSDAANESPDLNLSFWFATKNTGFITSGSALAFKTGTNSDEGDFSVAVVIVVVDEDGAELSARG